MSLVRWGQDGSSVYVYNTNRGIQCCCGKPGEAPPLFQTDAEIAAHLRGHRAAGDTIPEWCFDVLEGRERKLFYINQPAPSAPGRNLP